MGLPDVHQKLSISILVRSKLPSSDIPPKTNRQFQCGAAVSCRWRDKGENKMNADEVEEMLDQYDENDDMSLLVQMALKSGYPIASVSKGTETMSIR
ncbi:unnamed protein product [Didymodactylos carnosus]|uniref:Uncharacterized protein n=1 Tax=Didymodactylos carnosus TaxID=1234261 RepID=A0A814NZ95_9BILA|nr:unnamed protein product [Didymodactylos carnosus]CAF1096925.1 unnamed protein product [Didymodactylos carnosus]CAF3619140.1 unnamed protein product [Didymodactylos carnosus]CAF3862175.1 unnamed protein product [Didymodactylos carnosus]